jgi:hypothetical protein
MKIVRATIIVSVGVPGEAEAAEAWFAKWRPHLAYCSENTGCGCCVDIWDVEAPYLAVEELPASLRAMSDWSHPGRSQKVPKPPVRKKGQKLPRPRSW